MSVSIEEALKASRSILVTSFNDSKTLNTKAEHSHEDPKIITLITIS